MKTILHGKLQSTEDPGTFYGHEKYPDGPIVFDYYDIMNALEILEDELGYVDYASTNGDTGETLEGEGMYLLSENWWCRRAEYREAGRMVHEVLEHYPSEAKVLETTGCDCTMFSDEFVVVDDKIYRIRDAYGFSNVQWSEMHDWLTPDSPVEDWIEWAIEDPGSHVVTRAMGPEFVGEGFHEVDPTVYGPWEELGVRGDQGRGWGGKLFLEAMHKRYGSDIDIILEHHSWINGRGVYWRRNTEAMENGLCGRCVAAIENGDCSGFENEPDGSPGKAERSLERFLEQWGNVTIPYDVDPEDYSNRGCYPVWFDCMGCGEKAPELWWFYPEDTDEEGGEGQ